MDNQDSVTPDSSLVIVCFGDSLTAGYQVNGPTGMPEPDAPYGYFLQQWLGNRGKVSVSGICGELTQDMVTRFPRDVVTSKPHYAVILGGTNDLGWDISPEIIHQNLIKMYRMALDAGIQPIGVTVPSLCPEQAGDSFSLTPSSIPSWIQEHVDRRIVLNCALRESCHSLNIRCVDLFRETSEGPFQLLMKSYSSDGLHLNTEGYKQFARIVWREIFSQPWEAS